MGIVGIGSAELSHDSAPVNASVPCALFWPTQPAMAALQKGALLPKSAVC